MSCKKDGGIVNEQLIVSKIDLSLPTDLDIFDFDIVDENLYFVAAGDGSVLKIFRTNDGGKNWVELNKPEVVFIDDIQSISFIDENNGIIVCDNEAFRTYNGGADWTSKIQLNTPNSFADEFIFAGKTENNEFILVESSKLTTFGFRRVFTTAPNSLSYNTIFSINVDDNIYDYAHYADGKLVYFCRGFNCPNTKIATFNTSTLNFTTLDIEINNKIGDAIYFGDALYVAENYVIHYSFPNSDYIGSFKNKNPESFTSIEKIGNYLVAVGRNQIVTNYRGYWEEAINKAGKPMIGEFLKVKNFNDKYFLVSGKKGQFFKASFQ